MPYRYNPIGGNSSFSEALPVINSNFAQLDQEAVTKTFKQASGNAIITGKLPYDGGYGTLYYDQNGIPSIVIGIMPDGTTDFVVAKPGQNVLDLFS
jgi:hypothetical protein